MGMLKMRSVLHCAILLPSRCKQWGAWVSYVEPAVHRFPIKFSQRRVVHWLRHQYIGNLREGTCLLPNCRASTTISTNLKRQTLSQGWATLPCLNSRETQAFLFLGGQIYLIDQSWPVLDTSISILFNIGMISKKNALFISYIGSFT